MLAIESLSVCVKNFQLKNININLQEGEILGIVGESGSEKTLLSYLILRLISHYKVESGRIIFLGKNLLGQNDKTVIETNSANENPLSDLSEDELRKIIGIGKKKDIEVVDKKE